MELNRDELPYFIEFVLLGEASRKASGKRQTKPMRGPWISHANPRGLHLSDAAPRRMVCIAELWRVGGFTIAKAAAHVASMLRMQSQREVDQIRVAYYKQRARRKRHMFYDQFLGWREWILKAPDEALQFALDRYEHEFGLSRDELQLLFEAVAHDPAQKERHRQWITERALAARNRIEAGIWDSEEHWQLLATDHWALGVYSMEVGDLEAAKRNLANALEIWTTRGTILAEINPNVQRNAIAQLKAELACLDP